MEHNFWHNKWQINQIGFHQKDEHSGLINHFPKLASGAKVLVPLCGKTVDMIWLAQQGYHVVGVELSELAAHAFLEENQLTATRKDIQLEGHSFVVFTCEALSIELYIGDFFKFNISDFDGIYDRAALIALPESMRSEYVQRCRSLLAAKSKVFVVSIEYDKTIASGPPFSVEEQEIVSLWEREAHLLSADDLIEQESRWREKGLTSFIEKVWLLEC